MQPRENFQKFHRPSDYLFRPLQKKPKWVTSILLKFFREKPYWGFVEGLRKFLRYRVYADRAGCRRRDRNSPIPFSELFTFPIFWERTRVVHFASLIFAVAAAVRLSSSLGGGRWVPLWEDKWGEIHACDFAFFFVFFCNFLSQLKVTERERENISRGCKKMLDVKSK